MRHAAIYTTLLMFVSLGASTSDAQIAWEGKLRDAHTKAKQQGKLMLLHFYTDNCVYCDRLEQGAFRSASVYQSINENFVPVKVHGGKNPQLAKMFKVDKYPTDVVVTINGDAISHSVSPQQPDRYIAMLTNAQVHYAKTRMPVTEPVAATPAAAVASTNVAPPAASAEQAPAAKPASMQLPVQVPSDRVAANTATTPTMEISAPAAGKTQSNHFALPGNTPPANTMPGNAAADPNPQANVDVTPGMGAVKAQLASARSEGTMLPPDVLEQVAQEAQASQAEQTKPELAIQGYCPVSVVKQGKWVEGKPEFGVIHLGRLYLFADKVSMDQFLADPIPYTPMLNEIDVVRFFEEKKIVRGKREWGVIDPKHNRMYFFSDEAAMLHFENSFDRYVDAAIEVMEYAIKESNPGV